MKPRSIPASAGLGLRPAHYDQVLEQRPAVAWFEVHAGNHMTGGNIATDLWRIAADYPLSLHAVGLSLGSTSGPEHSHLEKLRELVIMLQPDLISDHLALPYTDEMLRVVIGNIHVVQETLRRRLLIKNRSRHLSLPYSTMSEATMSEAEFLSEVVSRTGCGILLDVNNLYVTAVNTGAAAVSVLDDFLSQVSPEDIAEVHLAGHNIVCAEVWQLFEAIIAELGPVPALVEWDAHLPSFEMLQAECDCVQAILSRAIQLARVGSVTVGSRLARP